MPEFWTWWIQNGPTTCTPSPSSRCDATIVLRQLVGDDRRERDRRERQPLRPRRRERARRATRPASARPSTSRRGRRAAREQARSALRLGARACSRCRASPTDAPRAARRAISLPQLVHVPYVPSSIRFSAASISRSTCSEFSLERVVDLAVERRRWRSRRGGCRSSPRPPRPRPRASRDARRAGRDRALDPLALVEQRVAEVFGVDARQRLSFLPRSSPMPRRGAARSAPARSPSARRSCPGRRGPKRASAPCAGSASASASSRRTASFARPRSGASVTRTFQASPCRPTIAARPAPGLTRRRSRVVSAVMRSSLRRQAYAAFASGTPYQRARRRVRARRRSCGSVAADCSSSSNAASASRSCARSRRDSVREALVLGAARRAGSRAPRRAPRLRISSASRRACS